jgi:predicted metalloprotease with PDZ domain
MRLIGAVATMLALTALGSAQSSAPVEYRLTFPSPEHRWMQVEVRFTGVPAGPLQLRMSRTSPGRYALHEFSKNVFDVKIANGKGAPLTPSRPNLHQWNVAGHDGSVTVGYKVYGDRVDGTYLSIDASHAHINMPAALMFARGWFDRPARVTFTQPPGRAWKVASQLFPTSDPLVYTAPNIHYLMDSPTEFSNFTLRTFTVDDGTKRGPPPTFRIALHHDGTEAEADAFAKDVEAVVREAVHVFGEFPQFDANTYTFLSDYLPWASGDGMEHRNSTVLSSSGSIRNNKAGLLGTVSHEFFHAWNMERIRSGGIEPFDFEEADVSGELWLGEGFTSYFDDLILHRAGLLPLEGFLGNLAGTINTVLVSPGRQIRSAVEMSELAPFVDAASAIDRTAWPNLFISYYTWGAAIGLGLDLSLRDRTGGKVTGDDFMKALWQAHGRPGQKVPGIVATPYTMSDLKEQLASLTGDRGYTANFFTRYIEGHDVVDYTALLARAGFVVRKRAAGRPWLGQVALQAGAGSVRVGGLVPFDSPLYKAGIEQDDAILSLGGAEVTTQAQLEDLLGRSKPGQAVAVRFVRRSGEKVDATLTLDEDPRIEIVPVEKSGGTLSAEQKQARQAWLSSRQR